MPSSPQSTTSSISSAPLVEADRRKKVMEQLKKT